MLLIESIVCLLEIDAFALVKPIMIEGEILSGMISSAVVDEFCVKRNEEISAKIFLLLGGRVSFFREK